MAATTAKPQLAALKTPLSATYPSELRSPMVGTPTFIKKEEKEGLKTPITPPAAYVDFLKALSPVLMSPMPTGTRYSFSEKPTGPSSSTAPGSSNNPTDVAPPLPSRTSSSSSVATTATADSTSTSTSAFASASTPPTTSTTNAAAAAAPPPPPADRPPCSTNPSQPSTRSNSVTSTASTTSTISIPTTHDSCPAPPAAKRPMSITIPPPLPPSPFPQPLSARATTATPRTRLHIPQSPYSPAGVGAGVRSPRSAHSVYSPWSAGVAMSSVGVGEWEGGVGVGEGSGKGAQQLGQLGKVGGAGTSTATRQVSVRQVVTRTVMYSARKPVRVEPVPVGKKRKIEE